MLNFRIGNREVGEGKPVYIIAEAGVNHNGSLEIAKKLVLAAKRTGADCVKFQTFKADALVTKSSPKASYQLKTTNPGESQFDMLKKLELSLSDYRELIDLCKKEGIQFLSTPYSTDDADFLHELGVDAFKVASGQISEPHFLEYLAKKGLPMIVSTGMADLAEVARATETIFSTGNRQLCVLQCTTNYPSSPADANLLVIPALRSALGVTVGYSDHIPENHCAIASVALGATVLEKHFTLDTSMDGPDHSCSLDEPAFADLVNGIRMVEQALGSSVKKPSVVEVANAKGMRRSVVAGRRIEAGEAFSLDNLALKRPATGLPPAELSRLLGKKARVAIEKDTQISFSEISW